MVLFLTNGFHRRVIVSSAGFEPTKAQESHLIYHEAHLS